MKIILTILALLLPSAAFATNIDGLPAPASISGADLLECEQSGVNGRCTMAGLQAFMGGLAAAGTIGDAVVVGPLSSQVQDASAVASINFPVGLSSTQAIVQSGAMTLGTSIINFNNTASGTCNDSTRCYINLYKITETTPIINNSAFGRYHNWWDSTIPGGNMGTSSGGFVNEMDLFIGSSTPMSGSSGAYQWTNFRPFVDVNGSFGGTGVGNERGTVFAMNPGVTLGANAANMNAGVVQENDFAVATGVNYNSMIFVKNDISSVHRTAGTKQNVSYVSASAAQLGGLTPGFQALFQDGEYDGFPGLDTGGTIYKCYPHANNNVTFPCGTIGAAFDLSNYAAITGNILDGPGHNGKIDGAFNITANSYSVGATAGVSCSATPGASFASVNGIVTHC